MVPAAARRIDSVCGKPTQGVPGYLSFRLRIDQAEKLAQALLDIVRFWVDQGIRIFRVDNPHTKPLRFWEWLIREIKQTHPETIFLAEAFTRPKTMYRLAKGGFTQSYTYFTWRNLKWEIEQYFEELNHTPVSEFFWPNLWPNTPDILPEYLQLGGRPAFVTRLVLAATLSSNYGIYGPVFELCRQRTPGTLQRRVSRFGKI
jgi:starch synthase (maltosyl-transferring)